VICLEKKTVNISWKTCFRIGISAFLLFLGIYYWSAISGIFATLLGAAAPVVIGFAIAYVLNILMSFYERHYFKKSKKRKLVEKTKRPVCLTGAILTLLCIIALIVLLVVPELVDCVKFLVAKIPPLIEELLNSSFVRENIPKGILARLSGIDWIVIGTMTGAKKNKIKTDPAWAYSLSEQAHALGIPVFMKEDLVPIIGEENMIQQLPDEFNRVLEEQKKWNRQK